MTCPFCELTPTVHTWTSDLSFAFCDRHPVSPGHTLVVPRRHVETYFEATEDEKADLWRGVNDVQRALDAELHPDGYNVGFNAGAPAGQTVMHAHVHVIPRFTGDMLDPRGGVRGVIPGKQKYGAEEATPVLPEEPFGEISDFLPGQESEFLPQLQRAMRHADHIDLLSAFVQQSGVRLIADELVDALERRACVRVLTGDYLAITDPAALQQLYTLTTQYPNLTVRFFEAGNTAFHPKAYVFRLGRDGIAFVGSSNLSRSALTNGVEWNLRAATTAQRATFDRIVSRFDALWNAPASRPLTADLVASYQKSVRARPAPEPAPASPQPNAVQSEALQLLAATRAQGARRGLVVMATGLGKTYLSAFDVAQSGSTRVLFLAHREEILEQAERAYARVFPDRTRGMLVGDRRDVEAQLLFGSVQTVSRAEHLFKFDRRHFDYIVVDEFHHAAAGTYRRVLAHFEPRFLLGLTATPDRLDGASLRDLCDDNLVASVGLIEGITRKLLVPFHYYGVKDTVDYAPIPWRSGRFDEAELTRAVATEARAAQALREYRKHAVLHDRRTIAFCVSRVHADHMASYLRAQGVTAQSVHSGETSAPRAQTLAEFRDGRVEVLCAVDVFNEGLDVPDLNTVLMLRPTESPVVFLQQLGRGLRRGEKIEKQALTVVDLIGNHRSFLRKPQALLALTGQDAPPGLALRLLREGRLDLPPGCSVDFDTETMDLLESISKLSSDDRLVYAYAELRDTYGHRPRAAEVFAAGLNFEPVKQRHGTWFDFVASQGDLSDDERSVLDQHRDWFRDLLVTQMTKSFKMVALDVMLGTESLTSGIDVRSMAAQARVRLVRDVVLRADLRSDHNVDPNRTEPSETVSDEFLSEWRKFPLRVFHDAKGFSRRWFRLSGDRFESELGVSEKHMPTFIAMTSEMVEIRLREYKARHRYADEIVPFAAPITLRVSHSSGNPILRFDRGTRSDIPDGEVAVRVDSEPLTFAFRKIAVNVATERSGGPNVLPATLRRWFGVSAGLPGTRHEVVLERNEAEWRMRPLRESGVGAEVIAFPRVPYFENLRVACGPGVAFGEDADRRTSIAVGTTGAPDPKKQFVVVTEGDSMDGGDRPIRDGDLVLCEWVSAVRPEEVEGKACLLAGVIGADLAFAQIKVPVRSAGRWFLRSANAKYPDQAIEEGTTLRVVARVIEPVRPALGLSLWGVYGREDIARQFGGKYGREWQVGHLDLELNRERHSVLLVTLHKASHMSDDYHYADRFVSPSEFEWESQNQTTPNDKKGRGIVEQDQQGRTIHLFVRFHGKTTDSRGEPFVYCGPITYVRHQGEKPMRVWFRLAEPLPRDLFRAWTE